MSYTTEVLEVWEPLVQGNMETGQIVQDSEPWDDPYEGPDYRLRENKPPYATEDD